MSKLSRETANSLRGLDRCIRLAKRVLSELQETKAPGKNNHLHSYSGVHNLSFLFFTVAIRVATSLRILIRAGRPFEGRLLNRVLLESVGSVFLLLQDTTNCRTLVQLYIEHWTISHWDTIELHRKHRGLSRDRWFNQNPQHRDLYEKVRQIRTRRHEAARRRKGRRREKWPPGDWTRISFEKRKDAILDWHNDRRVMVNIRQYMDDISTAFGNAIAHSGPNSLAYAVTSTDAGPKYLVDPGTRKLGLFRPPSVANEATIYLLIVVDYLVARFHLSQRFVDGINAIRDWMKLEAGIDYGRVP